MPTKHIVAVLVLAAACEATFTYPPLRPLWGNYTELSGAFAAEVEVSGDTVLITNDLQPWSPSTGLYFAGGSIWINEGGLSGAFGQQIDTDGVTTLMWSNGFYWERHYEADDTDSPSTPAPPGPSLTPAPGVPLPSDSPQGS
ncbi:hypothetical protein DIPPA_06557 [Diplonema papillatum]|nr:hypothetical protein DIPPA_06557 [Diplonema papillatum]